MSNFHTGDDEPGGLRPLAEVLGAIIVAAGHCSRTDLPFPPRLAKLGRDLTGEPFRPVLVWQNQ